MYACICTGGMYREISEELESIFDLQRYIVHWQIDIRTVYCSCIPIDIFQAWGK